jgi:hypothetical protein
MVAVDRRLWDCTAIRVGLAAATAAQSAIGPDSARSRERERGDSPVDSSKSNFYYRLCGAQGRNRIVDPVIFSAVGRGAPVWL